MQAVLPSEGLGKIVSGTRGHHRYGEKAYSANAESEEEAGSTARQRTEGFRGVRCTGNVVFAGGEQRSPGGQHHEIHHEVRKEHSEEHVAARLFEFLSSRSTPLRERSPADRDLLFDFLVGLPSVDVGGERCADHSY